VVIGGLIKDYTQLAEQKVPLLGDIPIIGYLFKSHKKRVNKTNLLIFITPHIVRDARDMADVTKSRYQKMERFKEQNSVIEPKGREPIDTKRFEAPPEEEEGGIKEEEIQVPQEVDRQSDTEGQSSDQSSQGEGQSEPSGNEQ